MPIRTRWTNQPTSSFGAVGFLGVGGLRLDGGSVVQVPAGVGLGYRRRLGETRAVAVSATPFFAWYRVTESGTGEDDSNLFRTTLAADLLVTRSIGVTAAYELGATAGEGAPGPTGGLLGIGLSYTF